MDLDVRAMVQLVHLQVQRQPNKLRGGSKASRKACRRAGQYAGEVAIVGGVWSASLTHRLLVLPNRPEAEKKKWRLDTPIEGGKHGGMRKTKKKPQLRHCFGASVLKIDNYTCA